MKFKKGALILKEAIKNPENLVPGDKIAIKLDNDSLIKFEVVKILGDSIILSSGKSKYKIPLESLTQDGSRVPFQKIDNSGNKSKGSVIAKHISKSGSAPIDTKVNTTGLNHGDVIRIDTEEKGPIVYKVTSVSDDFIELDSDTFDETHYIQTDADLTPGNKITINTAEDSFEITIKSIESAERSDLNVDDIAEGDTIKALLKDKRIYKFLVHDADDDTITVETKGNIVYLDKESLDTYTETGYITYRPEGSDEVKKINVHKIIHTPDTTPTEIEPEEEPEEVKEPDEERISNLTMEFNELNEGDTVSLVLADGSYITFKIESSETGNLVTDYMGNKGFPAEKMAELTEWDDILISTNNMKAFIGQDSMEVSFVGQTGGKKKTYTLRNVERIDYDITPENKATKADAGLGVDFVKDFYNTLKDIDGEGMVKLTLNDGTKNGIIYLEPIDGYFDADSDSIRFNVFDRSGDNKAFYSDLNGMVDSDALLVTDSGLQLNDEGNQAELTLRNEDGKTFKITGIVDYAMDMRDKEDIENLSELPEEEVENLLFNDPDIQDLLINNRGLFAKLLGKKKLGWIPSIQRYNVDTYGDNYDKLKKNNTVYFKFVTTPKEPYKLNSTLKGRLVEKKLIKIKTGNFTSFIKIIKGGDEQDEYIVEVTTDEVVKNEIVNSTTYSAKIVIKNYNA